MLNKPLYFVTKPLVIEILNQIVYLNPLINHNNKTIPIHKTYKSWATIRDLWDEEEIDEYAWQRKPSYPHQFRDGRTTIRNAQVQRNLG